MTANPTVENNTTALNFSALQRRVRVMQVLREFRTYDASWRVGVSIVLLVVLSGALIPIIMVASGAIDGGGMAFGIFLFIAGLVGGQNAFKEITKNVRMRTFAAENGLQFASTSAGSDYWGFYFRARLVLIADMLRTPNRLFYELGNLRPYAQQQQRSASGATYGYLRIKLERSLPHLMLQARHGFQFALPSDLDPEQRLSLEGDFDKYFTLYAPRHFEREALYIFTPDIMARFIDQLGQFNAEIIEDELYLYAQKQFDLTQPQVITDLFKLLADFMPKFDRKIAFYRKETDSLAVDPMINPPDRLHFSLLLRVVIVFLAIAGLIGLIALTVYAVKQSQTSGQPAFWRFIATMAISTTLAGLVSLPGQIVRTIRR